MEAFVTIHDLMPGTLERVQGQLAWLASLGVPPVTLLVVPGKPWSADQLGQLRDLAAAGHHLAAHGWAHETTPRRLYHRLHAALISRGVAEHLALDASAIESLMGRSHAWFAANALPEPKLYVPPAWALGPIPERRFTELPYAWIETTAGLFSLRGGAYDTRSRPRFRRLPLTGYEADTAARVAFLRAWNRWQAASARRTGRVLRISIHPHDLELGLADQLAAQIRAVDAFVGLDDLS